MAERSEPCATLCLVWNTEKPSRSRPRQSNDFSLIGEKCYLRLGNPIDPSYEDYDYCVSLHQYTETEELGGNPVYVQTFIENEPFEETHTCVTTLMDKSFLSFKKQTVIWAYSATDVLRKFDKNNTTWRVTCVFYGLPPLTFLSKIDTINLADIADESSWSTAEKCAQASAGVPPDIEKLTDDFSGLLTKEIFSDMKLNCAGQTRSGHRSILAARSEVFSAMFRNKMAESETGSVNIEDMDVPILDMFLQYVYTAKISDLTDDTATGLYEAGDKYAINTLKRFCSDWMVRNLSEENCVSVLNVADAHSDDELKQSAVAFIFDHPTVFKSDAWVKLLKDNIK